MGGWGGVEWELGVGGDLNSKPNTPLLGIQAVILGLLVRVAVVYPVMCPIDARAL